MAREHHYAIEVEWTGNRGTGTSNYRAYSRDHVATAPGKPAIPGSSDGNFRGDNARWNPEELLVVSISQCHMLWYLHLASDAGIAVLEYRDAAEGGMVEDGEGGGRFAAVVLKPQAVLAAGADCHKALALHDLAHEKCFIANSLNFPVVIEPGCTAAPA